MPRPASAPSRKASARRKAGARAAGAKAVARPAAVAAKGTSKSDGPQAGAPYPARIARLAVAAHEAGLSHLLVTNPKDVGYLTGFLGGDSYMIVPASDGRRSGGSGGGRGTGGVGGAAGVSGAVIISDFRYREELEEVRHLVQIVIREASMLEAVVDTAAAIRADKLGLQAEHMTVALRQALAKQLGSGRLADTTGLVGRLRVIKDESEIALIASAAKLQEAALLATLPEIRPGMTELEVAARLEAEMKTRGSSQPGFQTIIAAGPNGALPHYRPGRTKVAKNKPLLIDWGAVYRGYHADMTRTFAIGRWPAKIREIYAVVLEAQLASAAALAPGKTTAAVDAVARDIIAQAGYGEHFGHGLGHGLGLDGHEDPRLTNMLAPTVLEPGMVVTVEPGIYLPGIGGVRIEDDYVITPQGAKNLCSLPKDMQWASR